MITLGSIFTKNLNGNFHIEVPVTMNGETRPCWYELPNEYQNMVAEDRCDAFIAAMLLPALYSGEDITCEAPVSEQFLYNINNQLIPTLNAFFPQLAQITVHANHQTATFFNPSGVGSGFSGGIDSFVTMLDYLYHPILKHTVISHLFFFNVGAHGMGHTETELNHIRDKFYARYNVLKPFADEMSVPFIPVDSNVHSFHELGHLEGCGIVTPGTALLFQRGLRSYLIASPGWSHNDNFQYLKNPEDTLVINNAGLWYYHFFNTENTTILSVGDHETRISKIKRLLQSDFKQVPKYLNVCGARDTIDTNCSICEKCCRTIIMLDMLGKVDKFQKCFDIPKYRKIAEKRFIAKILAEASREPFYKQIKDFAQSVNYDLEAKTTIKDKLLERFMDSTVHNFLRKLPIIHTIGKAIKDKIE